jgi:hypothetical protein
MKEHKAKYSMDDATYLGITAIISIFIIVLIAINSSSGSQAYSDNNNVGKVAEAFNKDFSMCKIIVGQTTSYDDNVMAVSLGTGDSTEYTGFAVSVASIDDKGCMIDVDGKTQYLVLGQIQKVGPLYVTVKDITV